MIVSLSKRKKRSKKNKKQRNTKNDYFTPETDKFIIQFIRSKSDAKKNAIFEKEIKKVFSTLVSNLIYVYKVSELDQVSSLRDDCVRYLFEKIETFEEKKATKAFSYFNVIARNWFFQRFNSNKKDEKKFLPVDSSQVSDTMIYRSKEEYESDQFHFFDKEFLRYLIENFVTLRAECKERERAVLDSIIHLLDNPECVDVYNKKAIYIYIKNMTNLNPKQIALAVSEIKEVYYDLKNKWIQKNCS